VVQIIGKILRHGYSSYHPNNHQVDNRQMLEEELGDLDAAILLLVQRGDISLDRVNKASLSKQDRGSRYLHHNHWDLPPCDP
jgi:hypothetical protein